MSENAMSTNDVFMYGEYKAASMSHTHEYILPTLLKLLKEKKPQTIIELGCGNGSVANILSQNHKIVALDASESGIKVAQSNFPDVTFHIDSVYSDLPIKYGKFDAVISLEVIEHLYDPRTFIRNCRELMVDTGCLILSTPYHGYFKNLALAATGKMDAHFTALWDGGHIKFWSAKTITEILNENGLKVHTIFRVGRFAPLAKSMIVVATKK